MAENTIDQELRQYYEILGYDWVRAIQNINLSNGKVLYREFSELEFESNIRADFVDTPPDPQPYYPDDEEEADSYFRVVRTAYNTVYRGANVLEIGGVEINEARKFRQWSKTVTTYDYEHIFLNVETDFLEWKPIPPPPPSTAAPGEPEPAPVEPDKRWQLFLGEKLLTYTDANVLAVSLAIPKQVLGAIAFDKGVFMADSTEVQTSGSLEPGTTYLINNRYIQLQRSPSSLNPIKVSLRGKSSPYLAGEFLFQEITNPIMLTHPAGTNLANRLKPPGVDLDASFPSLKRSTPTNIKLRNTSSWDDNY